MQLIIIYNALKMLINNNIKLLVNLIYDIMFIYLQSKIAFQDR